MHLTPNRFPNPHVNFKRPEVLKPHNLEVLNKDLALIIVSNIIESKKDASIRYLKKP